MPRLSKLGAAALAAFGWTSGSTVSATYLVVAGGGGGGRLRGGGGGAGGYRTGTLSLNPTLSYTVTVGAGGAGSTVTTATGTNGSDSVFSTITSTGGGGGGTASGTTNTAVMNGATGGSGGGGATDAQTGTVAGLGGAGNTPSTSPSQGNNGGASVATTQYGGGGGGGSGGTGSTGLTSGGGAGGTGTANSISGSSVTYAGGGGGGGQGAGGAGGSGGGGAGASGSSAGSNGTANLGGGGGGDGNPGTNGGSGGSGVVIISYAGAQQFGGGVVTSDGTNTIHTFTTSGTLVPATPLTAQYLVVAGGGGGSTSVGGQYNGGAGGAGGFRTGTGLTIDTNSTYLVTVGSGGAINTNGSDSAFSSTTSTGGGKGGAGVSNPTGIGSNGGSGGGGAAGGSYGGAGGSGNTPSTSPSQGSNGGTGYNATTNGTGGGGGASAAGGSPAVNFGGNGGAGTASSISGTSVTYAGGGGGGVNTGGTPGTGGAGGGGAGSAGGAATAGTANLGGGGGSSNSSGSPAAGGSGVVIISYPGSTQLMAGGTVTITGGNVIHTFTSTGYLAPLKYVGNSLRFRSSASAYLNRTPASASNRTTWTWSGWVKRGAISNSTLNILFSAGTDSTAGTGTRIDFGFTDSGGDQFSINADNTSGFNLITTQLFRDPAAWYHIVVAIDTTQATASNRAKVYVNGNQVTAFSTATYPTQNRQFDVNNTVAHNISRRTLSATYYFDGYLTEVNFIDGQQLTPNSFGTFNSYGVWQPITYGGSYGTNGFYLPFPNNSTGGSVSASYLVVAGGGGGGGAVNDYTVGGGGGAGGFRTGTLSLSSTLSYTVTVGAGASAGIWNQAASSGSNSVFGTITSAGGGGGANFAGGAANAGGSGGGGSVGTTAGAAGNTPSVSPSQGNNGGDGAFSGSLRSGGGGGGASAVGGSTTTSTGGAGGAGTASSISGSSVTYAGGGGGGGSSAGGAGGAGGGGAGVAYNNNGTAGTANTGGGGGGGARNNSAGNQTGGAGGSGIVIISYAGTQKYTGGTVTSVGGNTIHTFTTSGTFVLTSIFNDYSPNGNNWTGNNFDVTNTTATTYDSMTDVPTLTSATAANYAVLSPIDKGSEVTLANANLSVSWSGVTGNSVRATMGCTSGQWYWEVTSGGNSSIGLINFALPIVPASGNQWVGGGGFGAGGSYGYAPTGLAYTNNTGTSYGASFTTGDVIGVAFDSSAGTLTFYKNGVSQGVAYTGISTSILYAPAIGYFQPSSGTSNSFNFGQRPFTYTAPSGYVALNTYNL